ncbi:D-alanine--D-alanine ligase [Candidatus Jorgensenbacteria bacterium CG23_combo_of_CG06-09_8_20_14_all_54_14]|uniref:D-alanine--D-alanine ligase n=2 Tax=Candidatus Joergenseniibacteriota TaxID=1752739 RepID=A0A2G9Z9L5_9BACT|nr:MAG: D-alanine--D-alanine ligase [Candidatus Jorgensenbacteria bacterium CG23_combo_of_CG06-09_8_20_14_all_54_14]
MARETKGKKTRVAVLMGGPSSEHEVSLRSGRQVAQALDRDRYEVREVVISKKGEWAMPPEALKDETDVAFIALHGTYGEDGTVQAILEGVEMPYTGALRNQSALAMNKFASLTLARAVGYAVPHSFLVGKAEWLRDPHLVWNQMRHYLGFPFVVKPNMNGSSVGVYIIRAYEELHPAMRDIFSFSREALFQNFIEGREVTCAVADHGWSESAFPLPPTEIIPRVSHFFDYRAKYEPGGSYEITPARFPAPMLRRIQTEAVGIHKLLDARGISRSDFIVDGQNTIYFLEINTIPGFTEVSLVPKAAAASGLPFADLLDIIISAALRS